MKKKASTPSELTAADLPIRPPDELIRWAGKNLLDVHVMIYRTGWSIDPLTDLKEECVDARCSVCGHIAKYPKVRAGFCRHFYAAAPYGFMDDKMQSVISGNDMLCPFCGSAVKAMYLPEVRDDKTIASANPLQIVAIQGRLALIYWKVERTVDDSAKESLVAYCGHAYVVESDRICCFSGTSKWCSDYRYKDRSGKMGAVYPWDPNVMIGTTAENSKLDLYLKCDGPLFPVSYMRLWKDRPRVENLLVQGAGKIVVDMIARDCKATGCWGSEVNIPHLKDVVWRDKRPAQMLKLNKDEFRCAVQQGWSLEELEVYRLLRDRDGKVDCIADMPVCRKVGLANVKHLIARQVYGSVMKSVRYLAKQKKKDAITLVDYWSLLTQNGEDPQNPKLRYPQSLKRAHDQQSERQKLDKQRGYPEAFQKRTGQLSTYSYESDGLLIRPVTSAEELFNEGKLLKHCVYSYLTRHVRAETAIFLIRHSDDPDKPFFTLELNEANMSVVQNRGKCNCSRTPEVQAFEKKWLAWAKAQQANKRRGNVA